MIKSNKTFMILLFLSVLTLGVQASEVKSFAIHNCNLINKTGGSKIFTGVEGELRVHLNKNLTKIEIELDEYNQHWESRWFKPRHVIETRNGLYGQHLIVKKIFGLSVSETQEYFQFNEHSILLGQKVSEIYERSFFCELK